MTTCPRRATVFVPLLVLAVGCGPTPDPFYPVSGRITVGGKPLTKGNVTFRPDQDRGNNRIDHPFGLISSDGIYSVEVHGQPGARSGAYRVTVSATMNEPQARLDWVPIWLVHPKYTRYETTTLLVEVSENPAEGAYDFDLSPP